VGVRSVVILTAAKVELCYFGSHAILPEIYRPLLIDGLMQAGTTRVPQVVLRRRFKSFVIDELDELAAGKTCLIAHPGPATISLDKQTVNKNMVLAIGPEGGWTEYELEMFTSNGFQHFSLGERTLRTDTACVAILSVLGYIKLQK
jgi:RsmE family RNA methyltransferase